MRIGRKLSLGFLAVAILVGAVGYVSLLQLHKIAKPLNKDIPQATEKVTETSHLDGLAQFIRYYDEVLTQSARNYAFTKDERWKQRYKNVEPELDKIIKEAISKGDEKDKEFFSSVDNANLALVEMEYKSLELVDNGRAPEAVRILESSEYRNQKGIYEQGLRNYVHKRNTEYDTALSASTEIIHSANRRAQNLINISTLLISILVVIAVVLAIGTGLFISRSITRPLRKLENSVVEIGKGWLNTPIEVKSNDEIGELAASFRKMTEDLKETTTSISDLEKEIAERKGIEEERERLLRDMEERVKEITCMYKVTRSVRQCETLAKVFKETTEVMALSWQYPEIARAKVCFDGAEYVSEPFEPTQWKQSSDIIVDGEQRGFVEVCYQEERPELDEGPFLNEERHLIDGIAFVLGEAIERNESEQRREELLKEVEAINKELKDFAYIISHDLKSPLRGIKSLAKWLSADYRDKFNDSGKEQMDLLLNRTDRMQDLIDGVLQYSRVGRMQEEWIEVNLNELIPEVIDMVSAPENVTITVEGDLPVLECEKTRITQVFENLLSNAVEYMDKPQGWVKIYCMEEGDFWKFSVVDNGPGIREKDFERIFQIFQTLSPCEESESTGIGLTIAKKIVEFYGGRIEVESQVGQGSTFFFTFPKQKVVTEDMKLQASTV